MATTQTDRIRALNDDLRQHLIGGGAVITPGIAALGREAIDRIVKTIAGMMPFVTPTTRTENMTSGRSRPTGKLSFSRSIITTRPWPVTR